MRASGALYLRSRASGRSGTHPYHFDERFMEASLLTDGAQDADEPIGFERERLPRGVVSVELAAAADLLERARGADHTLGVEVGRGALEPVGRAPQRLAVARVERLPDLQQVPRRIVHEQPADLGEELAIAADAREHFHRHGEQVAVRRAGGGAAGHRLDERAQMARIEWLGEVLVHAGGETALTVALHRVRGHRDDRQARRVALGLERA